jgi:hypothetical protein
MQAEGSKKFQFAKTATCDPSVKTSIPDARITPTMMQRACALCPRPCKSGQLVLSKRPPLGSVRSVKNWLPAVGFSSFCQKLVVRRWVQFVLPKTGCPSLGQFVLSKTGCPPLGQFVLSKTGCPPLGSVRFVNFDFIDPVSSRRNGERPSEQCLRATAHTQYKPQQSSAGLSCGSISNYYCTRVAIRNQ